MGMINLIWLFSAVFADESNETDVRSGEYGDGENQEPPETWETILFGSLFFITAGGYAYRQYRVGGCIVENEVGNENENANTFRAYNPNGTENQTQQQQFPAYGQQQPPPPPANFDFNQPIQNENQNANQFQ